MKIDINEKQKAFIFKAVWNMSVLYDFDLEDKEFEKCYKIKKSILILETNKIIDDLK
jgi:hypothetical protein